MSYSNAVFYVDLEGGNDGARTVLTSVTASNPSGSITRMNKTAHGLVTGAVVTTSLYSAWLNGTWKITVVNADNFDLDEAVWQTTATPSGSVSPRGGSSKADAWKTLTSGATASRVGAGDTVRLMASPDPVLVGSATWTQFSKTVTLDSPVTMTIADCETAWTAATANVTQTADTALFKQGTRAAKSVIAAAFTTGKVAHFATGALDLSAYEQVSFWINPSSVGLSTGGLLSLRLCSDVSGDVAVHTMAIPALPASGFWSPLTFDFGAPLSASIQSVALYGEFDTVTFNVHLDNIIACKASAAPDALTLQSYLGKACNLSWTPGTAYATGDKRRPSQPMRNGLQYQASTGGTTGGVEPTWPMEYAVTVADGSVVWTCVALEDTWFPIQSISGTTVLLDNNANGQGNTGRGYPGPTETVASYRREAAHLALLVATATNVNNIAQGGTQSSPTSYSGGWDRAAMDVQSGETWLDAHNSRVNPFSSSAAYAQVNNLNAGRSSFGLNFTGLGTVVKNCHASGSAAAFWLTGAYSVAQGVHATNGNDPVALVLITGKGAVAQRLSANGNVGVADGLQVGSQVVAVQIDCLNNTEYAVRTLANGAALHRLRSAGNGVGAVRSAAFGLLVNDCTLAEALQFQAMTAFGGESIYSQKHNGVANNHLITTDGGTIASATDQRRTASGISWVFRPTSTNRGAAYPLRLSVAKIACAAGQPVSVSIWSRRDNANIKGELLLPGGQLAGVPADLVVACEPVLNTWAESGALDFTPTESGVVEVFYLCWDGIDTVNSLWIDDLQVTQA